MAFKSGSDRVQGYEFQDVLAVLEGPSPWREFIRANLGIAKSKFSSGTFKVVPREKFDEVLAGLNITDPKAAGVTNKQTGEITMKEWGPNSNQTYLLAALHECVHLVSHPAEQRVGHSTAFRHLGGGLLEGLVESVAEDILTAQRITLPSASSGLLGYSDGSTAIAKELVENFSVTFLARVLFQGNGDQLRAVMDFIYSTVGWVRIKEAISAGRIGDARALMVQLRAEEDDKRNKALRPTQQQTAAKALFDVIIRLT